MLYLLCLLWREVRSGLERAKSHLLACRLVFAGRSEGCHTIRRLGADLLFRCLSSLFEVYFWIGGSTTMLLSCNVAQSPVPRRRSSGGLWVPPAHSNYNKVWCLKQGQLNTFYLVSALLQVSGHTSVELSLGFFVPWFFLKRPELEFLAPNPLGFTERVQRGEQDTDTWALRGEAQMYIKLAVPLFTRMLRGRFTR